MFKTSASLIVALFSLNSFAYSVSVTEISSHPHMDCVIDCGNKPGLPKPAENKPGDTKPGNNKPGETPPTGQKPTDSKPGDNDGLDGAVTDNSPDPINTDPLPSPGGIIPGNVGEIIGQLVTIGNKVWDFILDNKPDATYNTLKASIVPSGVTSWTQLSGWSRPVSKTYRVQFKDVLGRHAGGFDYRITFISGGNMKGKGKFIGQIAVAPSNINIHTGRKVNFRAEILDPINFGTEEDPVAGVQLLITYNSPTVTRYAMHSAEYFLYGTGEIQKISDK